MTEAMFWLGVLAGAAGELAIISGLVASGLAVW